MLWASLNVFVYTAIGTMIPAKNMVRGSKSKNNFKINPTLRICWTTFMISGSGNTSIKLIERNQEYEIGELEFTHMFKTYKIKSKNYYVENTIRVKQIEGPFKVFEGMWTVLENETNSAQILFDANFELPFLLDNLVTDDMIDQFSNEALESFIKKTTNC